MALSPSNAQLPDPYHIDRLSNLPDELLLVILSLLPTRIAARTSLLSRQFRYLWEASPSVDLKFRDFTPRRDHSIPDIADRLILRRNPSHSLLSFCLEFPYPFEISDSLFTSILQKLCCFSLSHLKIAYFELGYHLAVLPDIFSMTSLESLSLSTIAIPAFEREYVLPSAVSLTRLKTLSLELNHVDPNQLQRLISEPCSLEELHLSVTFMEKLNISSNTIRKLRLIIFACHQVTLCLPSLDLLCVKNKFYWHLPQFLGKISNLKKAVLTLDCVCIEGCSRLAGLMDYISNVEELVLHIKEADCVQKPSPILLEPGKKAPCFSNMKHLEATMCFHKHNFEAIVSIFHQSPALESVKLVHELPEFNTGKQKKDWKSKLPRNADRNHRYAYFRNLHLGENRLEFMKAMSKKCTSKRQAGDRVSGTRSVNLIEGISKLSFS